jgi:hypothetical protein
MSDSINPSTPPVWPPAPSGMETSSVGSGDIREFEYQNGWLMFLLLVVTLGLYSPFWMIRTAKTINRMSPYKRIPLFYAQLLLIGLIVDILLISCIGVLMAAPLSTLLHKQGALLPPLIIAWAMYNYATGISSAYREALNRILDRTSPPLRHFGRIGTYFFGPMYLQICLNKRIKEREAQVQKEAQEPEHISRSS